MTSYLLRRVRNANGDVNMTLELQNSIQRPLAEYIKNLSTTCFFTILILHISLYFSTFEESRCGLESVDKSTSHWVPNITRQALEVKSRSRSSRVPGTIPQSHIVG